MCHYHQVLNTVGHQRHVVPKYIESSSSESAPNLSWLLVAAQLTIVTGSCTQSFIITRVITRCPALNTFPLNTPPRSLTKVLRIQCKRILVKLCCYSNLSGNFRISWNFFFRNRFSAQLLNFFPGSVSTCGRILALVPVVPRTSEKNQSGVT